MKNNNNHVKETHANISVEITHGNGNTRINKTAVDENEKQAENKKEQRNLEGVEMNELNTET